MLSPLLFDIFFAAILLVTLVRFSEGTYILADLAHLQETALECVRGAIGGMLYADDVCMVSPSPRGPERMMAVFVKVFHAFGLTISESKKKTACMLIPRAC